MTFQDLGINKNIIEVLNNQNIINPTSIQEESYKVIEEGKDYIGCSETGSGKTLAYLLPLFSILKSEEKTVQVLIVVPTQELAMQVQKQIELFTDNSDTGIKSMAVIGDGNINRQIENLKNKPNIIVGTTNRILQLNKIKKLKVNNVKALVIDEADKMLDKTNFDSLLQLRKTLLKFTQVILFSASIDKKSLAFAEQLVLNPVITQKTDYRIPTTIKHVFVVTDRNQRIETLRKVASAVNSAKTIIFINTKYDLEESIDKLKYHRYNAEALYSGSDNKFDRKNAITSFKEGRLQYLIATDIAARGLQVNNIGAVINVNLPEDPKEYLHRAGRCGRNGKNGLCISIITENEIHKIKEYEKVFQINIAENILTQGKLINK